MEGQITITDFLKSKIELREVDDFTSFLNKQGKSQYRQIGDIIKKSYDENKDDSVDRMLDRITNHVSIHVLEQSRKYSEYLREQAKL